MGKLYKLLGFIFLLFLFSCYSYKIPNDVIAHIEMEDDNLCMMEGVEFDPPDTRLVYWQCRLRVIDQRISGEFDTYGYSALYKKEFKRLRKIIKSRIKTEKEYIVSDINLSTAEREHNYCIMKRDLSNPNINNYEKCREDLAKLREGKAKNKKTEQPNTSNEYVMRLFEYDDGDDKKISKVIYVNKECVKYAAYTDKLELCEANVKKMNQCIADNNEKILKRNIDDRVYCAKISDSKYPDSLSKFNGSKSGSSLGPKMDRMDIVNLRQKELEKCYGERRVKLKEYKEYLENECRRINLGAI